MGKSKVDTRKAVLISVPLDVDMSGASQNSCGCLLIRALIFYVIAREEHLDTCEGREKRVLLISPVVEYSNRAIKKYGPRAVVPPG